jgi:hypothetical protein
MDNKYISERVGSIRQQIDELRNLNAKYWARNEHAVTEKSAHQNRELSPQPDQTRTGHHAEGLRIAASNALDPRRLPNQKEGSRVGRPLAHEVGITQAGRSQPASPSVPW